MSVVLESLLLLKRLRYGNMNGTMLSQIVWIMFLTHHCLPKIAKKKPKVKAAAKGRLNCLSSKIIWTQTVHAIIIQSLDHCEVKVHCN